MWYNTITAQVKVGKANPQGQAIRKGEKAMDGTRSALSFRELHCILRRLDYLAGVAINDLDRKEVLRKLGDFPPEPRSALALDKMKSIVHSLSAISPDWKVSGGFEVYAMGVWNNFFSVAPFHTYTEESKARHFNELWRMG